MTAFQRREQLPHISKFLVKDRLHKYIFNLKGNTYLSGVCAFDAASGSKGCSRIHMLKVRLTGPDLEQMNCTSGIQACGVPVKLNLALMRSKSWSRSAL
jgi:hypothetical protein